jgi:hypothetical protein
MAILIIPSASICEPKRYGSPGCLIATAPSFEKSSVLVSNFSSTGV